MTQQLSPNSEAIIATAARATMKQWSEQGWEQIEGSREDANTLRREIEADSIWRLATLSQYPDFVQFYYEGAGGATVIIYRSN